MTRHLAVIGVALVVVAVAPAGAADVPIDPEKECRTVEGQDTAVVFLPTGDQVSENASLYPGTTVYVVVCSGGDPAPVPAAWNLDSNGLAIQEQGEVYVKAKVTGRQERIQVGKSIKKKPDATGPTIRVEGRSTIDSMINGSWQFPASGDARAYRRAEEAYLDANDSLRANVSRLTNMTSSLNDADSKRINRTRRAIARINRSVADVRAEREDLIDRLYAISWQSGGNGTALAAIRTLRGDNAPEEAATEALANARSELKERGSTAKGAVFLDLLTGFLPGALIVGAVAGWRIRRRASEVQYDQQFTRTRLDPAVLNLPLGVAVVGVLLAAGGMVLVLPLVPIELWVSAIVVIVATLPIAALIRFEVIP